MMTVNKHRIGYSGLSGTISLYRHGKDPHTALEKREAEPEVMAAVVEKILDAGGEYKVAWGNRSFTITVTETTAE